MENGLKKLYLTALGYKRCTTKNPPAIYWTVFKRLSNKSLESILMVRFQ